jgi:hypothetical protein
MMLEFGSLETNVEWIERKGEEGRRTWGTHQSNTPSLQPPNLFSFKIQLIFLSPRTRKGHDETGRRWEIGRSRYLLKPSSFHDLG